MDNAALPRRRLDRDYRREIRQERRKRRSNRVQHRYNYRGVFGSILMVLACLLCGLAIWFLLSLLLQFFTFLSNVNLKQVT